MNIDKITQDSVYKAVKSKGYLWFNSSKDLDLNIVGIRNSSTGKKVTNLFDDAITLSYKINGEWQFHIWKATTDPGNRSMKEFKNPRGVARLVPGQYRGSHIIRLHGGKYEALGQDRPMKVWRDKNKDFTFDEIDIQEGLFGINIHRSNPKTESEYVENWSEGCQVFKRVKDFNQFMQLCNLASKIHGNRFTYTLIESNDLK
jgi:hypothetical protein